MRFALDLGTPLALIANEALSNALKHAFPDRRRGSIFVRLEVRGLRVTLTIEDDGVGSPATTDDGSDVGPGLVKDWGCGWFVPLHVRCAPMSRSSTSRPARGSSSRLTRLKPACARLRGAFSAHPAIRLIFCPSPARGDDGDDVDALTRVKLLIVEDDPFIAMHLEMLVESWGYAVIGVCVTGPEAITMAELHRPDVILSDVKLLGPMDGNRSGGQDFRAPVAESDLPHRVP